MLKNIVLGDLLYSQVSTMSQAEVSILRRVLAVTLPDYINQAALIARQEAAVKAAVGTGSQPVGGKNDK